MMKNQNGITLIALVITIIVLLILAGVSIAMLSGDNGILNQSTKAVANTNVAEAKERAAMEVTAAYSEFLENKYTNAAAAESTFTGLTKDEAGVYEIEGMNITIIPKTNDNKAVTGTISADGKITWNVAQ